jgi:prepilin-type N-terminal cleavage/methylation domain-containing protein
MSTCSPCPPAHPSGPARQGMTLVEIMVASALLATGLFAGIGAIANAHLTSQRSMNTNAAIAEIQNQIEVFQALDDQALQARFAGSDRIYFAIPRLSPGIDTEISPLPLPEAGVIERVQVVPGSLRRTCLRISANWNDQNGQAMIEQFFFFTDRR